MKYVAAERSGDPSVLHVATMPAPAPAAGEVLIAVEAAGVSRADSLQRAGNYPPPQGASPILGLEVAGTIASLGAGVTQWNVGDRVCALCNGGGYAELVAVPQGQVLPIPEGWSGVEAATLPENAFTVYDNVFTRARLRDGETILVHGGSSGIGSTAIMFARAFGAVPIATAGTKEKCDACVRIGAKAAINYRTEDFVAEVLRLTSDRGADVVLDIVGGDYLERDLRCLARDGRIACIAMPGGSGATIDLRLLIGKRATVLGSSLRPRTAEQKAAIARELRERVWPRLPQRDPIRPIVDAVYPFDRAAEAHARLEQSAHVGKIVLTPA
ncbi:MAG TPA: NAD(P)H-quinone oxidoreductase [Candidatus Tumulicola sp.]|nr:NAD(P)H-quinone oxidoreductase [Candidatus Tumulicola sp.]